MSFSVNGTISDKIIIFDIDDTLIHSKAKVKILKDGIVTKTLSSSSYACYVCQPDETVSYEDFDSIDLLYEAEFTKYWETLKREYFKGTHIAILTARACTSSIKKYFLDNGIDIKDELIFCTGDESFPFKGSTVKERKAQSINYLYSLGYKVFVFFDDKLDNLLEAKQLEDKYNDIKINIVHVETIKEETI